MSSLFQSFINVDLWDRAKWRAALLGYDPKDVEPPFLGLAYENGVAGKEIFRELRARLGTEDVYEELRVSIIEGDIPGQDAGYSVHIGSHIDNIKKRYQADNIDVEFDLAFVTSRVQRMHPPPNSPNLPNFKNAFAKHGKYLLIPVSLTGGTPTPHFELAILKKDIHLRQARLIDKDDIDYAVFLSA